MIRRHQAVCLAKSGTGRESQSGTPHSTESWAECKDWPRACSWADSYIRTERGESDK